MVMRPDILQFGLEMESQMKANDEVKGDSWKTMSNARLLELLNNSRKKLEMANTPKEGRKHVVNIANYSMMLWHNNGEKE